MTTLKKLGPEVQAYYSQLRARNELTRSDVSIFPSYSQLTIAYRVVCRQRYYLNGLKQKKQFIKEIKMQEALQSRALDGVRVHREFCEPIRAPLLPEERITLTADEQRHLNRLLDTRF